MSAINIIVDFLTTAAAVTVLGILIIYVPAVMILIVIRVGNKWGPT